MDIEREADDGARGQDARVVEVLGVYDADGGLRGELTYVVGSLLGRAHCSLCDVTHSPVRRKRSWDAMVRALADDPGVPVRLAHRNELDEPERQAVAQAGLPVVLGRDEGGAWRVLLPAERLDEMSGSVDDFDRALRDAMGVGPGGAGASGGE